MASIAPPVALTGRAQIRPCMVSFYFHPDYSGSAIQALNLSRHLQQLGMRPMIVSANLSGSSAEESFEGIPVHRIPVAKHPNAQIPSFWLSAARFLRARRGEFDLIHAHGAVPHGIVSLLGRMLKKPTILKIAMADSDIAFHRQGRVFGRLNRFMVSRFDAYIATTEAIEEEFALRGLDRMRVRLIPNGVDTAAFSPVVAEQKPQLRRALGLPDGPLVTCVAAVNERKNIDGILRIWKHATGRGAEGHVAIVGPLQDPAYCERMRGFIRTNGLDGRVSFLGPQASVTRYLQASDVFLFPSKREGMPNAVVEAMACGLPCLVSRSSGTTALVRDGLTGYAMDVADETGFADRLVTLIADDSLRARLGRNARDQMVAQLSLTSTAVRYSRLYEELLKDPQGLRA